jgi:hypothetical protein
MFAKLLRLPPVRMLMHSSGNARNYEDPCVHQSDHLMVAKAVDTSKSPSLPEFLAYQHRYHAESVLHRIMLLCMSFLEQFSQMHRYSKRCSS